MEKVIFQPNVPVRMALKFADGKTVEGRFGDQEYYTLTDGRCMYVNPDVAAKVYELLLKPGEPFEICKCWGGKKGEAPKWDVRRVNGVPPKPQTETDLENDLRRSLAQQVAKRPGAAVSATTPELAALVKEPPAVNYNNGNGSKANGNGNACLNGAAQVTPAPVPLKIPLNIAFREILAFCTQELQAAHEQWSDGAAGPDQHLTDTGRPRGLVHGLGKDGQAMSTALKLVTQPSYRPGDISSPSSVSQYRKCGAFWRFKHIDHLPDPPCGALTQGSAVHAAIGENLRQKIETKKDLPFAGVKALFREAWALLVKGEFPGPFGKPKPPTEFAEDEDPATLAAEGEALTLKYLDEYCPSIQPAAVELPVEGRIAGVEVKGFIDLLDTEGRIIDLKVVK